MAAHYPDNPCANGRAVVLERYFVSRWLTDQPTLVCWIDWGGIDVLNQDDEELAEEAQDCVSVLASKAISVDRTNEIRERAWDNPGVACLLSDVRPDTGWATELWLSQIGVRQLSASALDVLSLIAMFPGGLGTPELECCWSIFSQSRRAHSGLTWASLWYVTCCPQP